MMKTKKYQIILTFFLALPIAFLIAEGLLRLLGFQPWHLNEAFKAGPQMIEMRDEIGWINKPGHHSYELTNKKLLNSIINSDGSRGNYSRQETHQENIWSMGGSIAFGFAVDDGKEYTAIMAEQLKDKFDVKNYGVSGYGVLQSMMLYDRLMKVENQAKPKYVVLGYLERMAERSLGINSWLYWMERIIPRDLKVYIPIAEWNQEQQVKLTRSQYYRHWPMSEKSALIDLTEQRVNYFSDLKKLKTKHQLNLELIKIWQKKVSQNGGQLIVALLYMPEHREEYINTLKRENISFIDASHTAYPNPETLTASEIALDPFNNDPGSQVKGNSVNTHPNDLIHKAWGQILGEAINAL